jgi:polar amino acid transport system substrate-binding protein
MVTALLWGEARADTWQFGPVRVCAEDAGWPPFSLPPKSDLEAFSGFNADILATIFGQYGIPFEVSIRPWKRCLLDGMNGDIDIVLDAAKNPERERDYLLTEPIYELTPVFFFATRNASRYPTATPARDFDASRVCGQRGYTYTNFGFDNARIEQVSADLPKILELVELGRCDIGLARLEVLLTELKQVADSGRFSYQRLQNAESEPFYWMLNRHAPFATRLKQLIDSEMTRLRKSGDSGRMLQDYLRIGR